VVRPRPGQPRLLAKGERLPYIGRMRGALARLCLSLLAGGAFAETKKSGAQTMTVDKAFDQIWDVPLRTLDGKPANLAAYKGKTLLVVNVASKCGLTPQYEQLESLQKKYEGKGFTVLGFPCNQFAGQEPGSAEEIREFCSRTYGVTFPIFEKIDVNGKNRHPVYKELTRIDDGSGKAGDIQWNFEKFVIAADGKHVTRFRPQTKPDDPAVVQAIESSLATKPRFKNTIVRFEIGTDDAGKARTFYESLFDWKIAEVPGGLAIDTGGEPSGGITSLGHEPRHYTTFYVQVEDIAASLAKVQALGGKKIVGPIALPTGSFAWFSDPEGSILGLWQPKE
jgi:glutathione peroxidase